MNKPNCHIVWAGFYSSLWGNGYPVAGMTAGGSAGKDFVGGVFKQGLKVPVPAWTTPTQTNVCAGPVCRNDTTSPRLRGAGKGFVGGVFKQGLKVPVPAYAGMTGKCMNNTTSPRLRGAGKDFVGGVFKQGLKVPVPAYAGMTGERSGNEIFHLHNLGSGVKPRDDNGGDSVAPRDAILPMCQPTWLCDGHHC